MALLNKKVLGLSSVLLIASICFYTAFKIRQIVFTPQIKNSKQSAIIDIQKGTTPSQVTKILYQNALIDDPVRFKLAGRLLRKWGSIKAGEYEISAGLNPSQMFDILTSGVSVARPFTIPEGKNMYQIADQLAERKLVSKSKFIKLCKSSDFIKSLNVFPIGDEPKTLEGYLYPDTYNLTRDLGEKRIILKFVSEFFNYWNDAMAERGRSLGLSPHRVITLASIIEKETGAAWERPLISSVFHNRLKKRMRLQSDPTTIYGIWERYDGNIRKKDLLEKTPYNTYKIFGLPLGPIANPGAKAIEAALNPEQSSFLYFVSKNDGTHYFSKTFKEHQNAVTQFQLNRAARRGKSWRDLSKKEDPQS